MECPPIHFGIETEIGITRDNEENLDVVAESIALVRSATELGVRMRWDYQSEDPHADVRGFHVDELRQDFDEANYFAQDAQRELTFAEIKSDVVLSNGARFYNDHAHPEYCTPECSTIEELVLHDRAGERLLEDCARKCSENSTRVRLYKNNTDFFGHSYGTHENYLIPRHISWDYLARSVQSFLVTRQIFAGAGKFGIEREDAFVSPEFQIAQRSDFFSALQSVDTMQRRPIINTRDEPHANPDIYRRFHVIIGDANMSPFATALKVGTTALTLEAICKVRGLDMPQLDDPLEALQSISRDRTFSWNVPLRNGGLTTAINIQREYWRLASDHCDLTSKWKQQTLQDWENVLKDLERDWRSCGDRLDWVAKWQIIEQFRNAENLDPTDPWLRSLDLEYHLLDQEEGLYYGLERTGVFQHVPNENAVQLARTEPPPSTRAWVRGKLVQKFGRKIISAQWDHVTLAGKNGEIKISLLDLFDEPQLIYWQDKINKAQTPDDL